MATTPTKTDPSTSSGQAKPEDRTEKPVEANEPYPVGNPPDPEDQFFAAHGFRREKAKEDK